MGFLPFKPRDSGMDLPLCIHYYNEEELEGIQKAYPIPQSKLKDKVLEVKCLSVKPSLRRKGLGSEMVRYLIPWAKEHGWDQIEGYAFTQSDFGWIPDISFWEKLGFKRRGIEYNFDDSDPITDRPGFKFAVDLVE